LFLGIALAFASFFVMYPEFGRPQRALLFAALFLVAIVACWIAMPQNRPHAGAILVRAMMTWSLALGAALVRLHIYGPAPQLDEAMILAACILVFVGSVVISRATKWGRKWFRHKGG